MVKNVSLRIPRVDNITPILSTSAHEPNQSNVFVSLAFVASKSNNILNNTNSATRGVILARMEASLYVFKVNKKIISQRTVLHMTGRPINVIFT